MAIAPERPGWRARANRLSRGLVRGPFWQRFWAAALVAALTLAALATGAPGWAIGALVALQGLLSCAVLRDTGFGDEDGDASGRAPLRDRAAVLAMVSTIGASGRSGVRGATLAVRIDDADRLVSRHGEASFRVLLDELGARLGRALRAQDLFCPLADGGFGVALFPQRALDLGGVLAVAQRIQTHLADPFTLDGASVWPSVSIGFATSPRAAQLNGLDMLQAAEIAADKALRAGPGGLIGYSVVDFPAVIGGDHLASLRRALDSGEIVAHFQPQIRTDTGIVSGIEALARWNHPQKGLISPAEFLPQIEAAGLSPRLADRMLRDSLDALCALDAAGLAVPAVSVNLSAQELRNPRLADEIGWELDRHDLTPDRLAVEILETVVADSDDDIAVRTIARLAAMGCGIDLDDFGTGHASIASIRRFAVGRIKIDRSFVTRLHDDRDQQRIVAAILSMAEQLGLATLAEGVECAEEQVMLAQMGCGHLQGYAIARPMPAADLPGWLRAHTAALAQGEPWCEDPAQARAAAGMTAG